VNDCPAAVLRIEMRSDLPDGVGGVVGRRDDEVVIVVSAEAAAEDRRAAVRQAARALTETGWGAAEPTSAPGRRRA
jgi:hypothetical protein